MIPLIIQIIRQNIMTINSINNSLPIGDNGKRCKPIARLRYVERPIICGRDLVTEKVMQQAWEDINDRSIVWLDIPVEKE